MKHIKIVFLNTAFFSIFTVFANNNLNELQKNLSSLTDQLVNVEKNLDALSKPAEVPIPKDFVSMSWLTSIPAEFLYQLNALPNQTEKIEKILDQERSARLKGKTSNAMKAEISKKFEDLKQEIPDDYHNSGYHALRDGFYLFDYLTADEIIRDWGNIEGELESAGNYAENLSKMKNAIIKYRTDNNEEPKDGGWLSKDDLIYLVRTPKGDFFDEMQSRDFKNHITIIDDINNPSQEIKDAIEKLKKESNFDHIFLLSYPNEYKSEPDFKEGKTVHWIAVAVHRVNGNMQYIVADSRNDAQRLQSKEVKKLMNLFKSS